MVGHHTGAELLTTGQGARISGTRMPYYVISRVTAESGSMMKHGNKISGLLAADVLVAQGKDHKALYSRTLSIELSHYNGVEGFSWTLGRPPGALSAANGSIKCIARTRHGLPFAYCDVSIRNYDDKTQILTTEAINAQRSVLRVCFEQPQRALTVGQVLALYELPDGINCETFNPNTDIGSRGLICLGGGPISHVQSFI